MEEGQAVADRPRALIVRGGESREIVVTPSRATPLGWAEPKPVAVSLWKKGKR